MSDLSAKFTALEEQLATQAATMGGYVDTVEVKLQAIFDELDLILVNNAANTKYLLAALGQTGACFPCPTPSITVPPIGTIPTSANSERCQRSQGIIATIHNILAAMDTLQSFNVIGTFNVLNDTISEVISGIVAGDTVPLPSFPETVNIVGDYISYAGERLFSGVGLIDQFSPLEASLLSAIAPQSTAEASRAQYESVIDASVASNGAKLLFKAVAYTALWSYYFDPDTTPDVSGFDGGACGFVECQDYTSTAVTLGGGGGYTAIVWLAPLTGTDHTAAGYPSDSNVWCLDNLLGYSITVHGAGVRIRSGYTDSPLDILDGDTVIFGSGEGASVISLTGEAFTAVLCPPA